MFGPRVLRILCWPLLAVAQDANQAAQATFQSKVRMVPVPVVVRDKKANAIGTLTAADFQVFDNGKRQTITHFSVDKSAVAASPNPAIPNRYFAYVFDDLHFNTSDLMKTRLAAMQPFNGLDLAASRLAVFTTSGMTLEDFTASREKLTAALMHLTERPQVSGLLGGECPAPALYGTALALSDNSSGTYVNAGRARRPCSSLPGRIQRFASCD